jgi:putative DNA primase/helicase
MTDIADAKTLLDRGFHLFPVDSPDRQQCGGTRTTTHDPATCTQRGKHPAVRFTADATDDFQSLAAILAGDTFNLGVYCAKSNLLIVDEDKIGEFQRYADDHGVTIPDTYTVRTGKGYHYYFRVPETSTFGNAKGDFAEYSIDIRAGNAYVVSAYSKHATGVIYTEVDSNADIAPCPDWIARGINTSSSVGGVVRGISAVPETIRDGQRHHELVSYAGSLRARSIPIEEAELLYSGAWKRCEQPPQCATSLDWREARGTLHDVYSRYPAGKSPEYASKPRQREPDSDGEDPTSGNLHSGQARIAYMLEADYVGKLLHVHGMGWLAWDGVRWAADDRGAAKRAVLHVLSKALNDSTDDPVLRSDVKKCESASGVAGVLDLASALVAFAVTVADLDADPYLLNVANGTLDLRTMDLRDHAPADRCTKVAKAAWRSDASMATWEGFLGYVLPDAEVREFLQRVAGVGLLGVVVEHVLPILTGSGANGKSVFDQAVRFALGDYASTVEPDLFLHRQGAHPTGEMDLLGKRWVVVSETEKDRRLAEATMKRLTGGDTIRARRMRQDFVEFNPSHTAILITNHLPKVSGDDPAIWRRLRVVPFGVVIPPEERDKHLAERLKLDADAILAWAVAGYADYQERGELAEPDSVLTATSKYQKSSDSVARFLDDCTKSCNGFATTGDLFARWSRWAAEDGADAISQRAFGEALDGHGFSVSKSNGRRVRRGLILLLEGQEDDL